MIFLCVLSGQYRNITEDDGTGVASSHLTMTLTRGDLGAKLECRGSSPVLETAMKAWVELDVYGKFTFISFHFNFSFTQIRKLNNINSSFAHSHRIFQGKKKSFDLKIKDVNGNFLPQVNQISLKKFIPIPLNI